MAIPAGDSHQVASGGVIAAGRYYGTPATSLTLTDTVHPRLYQRVGTAKTLMIGGSYTGPATRIQARACPAGTGLTALESTYPFSTVVNNPTGGTFSASLSVPQGDGWVVQVRDGVTHTLGSTGTHTFGVGVFIALIGQSNMENLFENITDYPLGAEGTYSTRSGSIVRLGNINPAYPPGTPASVYYPAGTHYHETNCKFGDGLIYAANRMRESLSCPIGIMDWAESGTWIGLWVPGESFNDQFLTGIAAIGGDFEAAIWLQGETDAQVSTSYATYKASLQSLYTQLKTVTGRSNLDFGVAIVGPATSGWVPTENMMLPIRKAQIDFINENSAAGVWLAGTDIDGDLGGGSSIHINAASLIRQGYRYGEAIVRRLSRATYGIEGPAITSASLSGATVTVSIAQHGGSALLDGVGGAGSALLGFRVFDGGAPCTISNTAISGNTISLTLSAAPSGVVTMDYCMANAPFGGTTAPASVCYDNQTIPGSTVGLPLQPKPLCNVS